MAKSNTNGDKPYDTGVKRLMTICPQDILNLLTDGAICTGSRSPEFQSLRLQADKIHEAIQYDKKVLHLIEIQSEPDARMDQRL